MQTDTRYILYGAGTGLILSIWLGLCFLIGPYFTIPTLLMGFGAQAGLDVYKKRQ